MTADEFRNLPPDEREAAIHAALAKRQAAAERIQRILDNQEADRADEEATIRAAEESAKAARVEAATDMLLADATESDSAYALLELWAIDGRKIPASKTSLFTKILALEELELGVKLDPEIILANTSKDADLFLLVERDRTSKTYRWYRIQCRANS